MKFKLLIIATIILSGTLPAQTRIGAILDTVTEKPSEALKEHYQLLHQAQLAYVRGELRKSAELFFQAHKAHRAIDMMPLSFAVLRMMPQIPIDSALLLGALEMVYRNVPKMSPEVDTFDIMGWYTDSFFKITFPVNREWLADYLQQFLYDGYREYPEIPVVLDSLNEADQKYRRNDSLWLTMRISGEAIKIDSLNQQALIDLFRKYPDFSAGTSKYKLSSMDILLQHFASNQFTDWYPYIKRLVLQGKIPNSILEDKLDLYVTIYNGRHNIKEMDYYGSKRIFALSDRVVVIMPNRRQLKVMNRRREEVMLPPFQESVEIRLHHHFVDPHPYMPSIDKYDFTPGIENTIADYEARHQAIRKLEDEYINKFRKKYGKRRVKVYQSGI
ncbi:MAG: hypothetical protein R6V49_11735 [Bacteroidales bacterium]